MQNFIIEVDPSKETCTIKSDTDSIVEFSFIFYGERAPDGVVFAGEEAIPILERILDYLKHG